MYSADSIKKRRCLATGVPVGSKSGSTVLGNAGERANLASAARRARSN